MDVLPLDKSDPLSSGRVTCKPPLEWTGPVNLSSAEQHRLTFALSMVVPYRPATGEISRRPRNLAHHQPFRLVQTNNIRSMISMTAKMPTSCPAAVRSCTITFMPNIEESAVIGRVIADHSKPLCGDNHLGIGPGLVELDNAVQVLSLATGQRGEPVKPIREIVELSAPSAPRTPSRTMRPYTSRLDVAIVSIAERPCRTPNNSTRN